MRRLCAQALCPTPAGCSLGKCKHKVISRLIKLIKEPSMCSTAGTKLLDVYSPALQPVDYPRTGLKKLFSNFRLLPRATACVKLDSSTSFKRFQKHPTQAVLATAHLPKSSATAQDRSEQQGCPHVMKVLICQLCRTGLQGHQPCETSARPGPAESRRNPPEKTVSFVEESWDQMARKVR